MKQRKLLDDKAVEKHSCTPKRFGSNLIFTCPACGYQRIISLVTGKTTVINSGNTLAIHSGWSQHNNKFL